MLPVRRHHLPRSLPLAIAPLAAALLATAPFLPAHAIDDVEGGAAAEGIRVFEPAYYFEWDPISALELVFRTPGFNPQQQDGGRGLSGVRSNVLINGMRPPPKGQSVQQQLREIPVTAVAYIELIDAGARLDIDMQGYPQVVNVVTVEDKPAYYEVVTQVHRAGTGALDQENARETQIEATGSFSTGPHEFSLRGDMRDRNNQSPADFVSIDPANPEQRISTVNTSQRDNYGLQLAADLSLPAASSMQITSSIGSWEQSSAPTYIGDSVSGPIAVNQTFANNNDNQEISAEYFRPFGANSNVTFAIVDSGSEEESRSSLTEAGNIRAQIRDGESGESAMRVHITQTLNERLTVRSEATTAFNYFEGGFRLFENGVEQIVAGSQNRVEEDRNSIEGSVDWNLSSRWMIQGRVGLESYDITSLDASSGQQTDPKGNFLVSYRPQPRTTISFESSRSIGQLSFNQFLASSNLSSEIVTAGAAALEPVKSWNHTAKYDRRFGDVGVMQFTLSRRKNDNPVRQVALSDELVVAQNTFPETIDRLGFRIEYPFERFGRDDLILTLQGELSQSDTIDPITLQQMDVSNLTRRQAWLEIRRDPGAGRLSWGASIGGWENGYSYSVRSAGIGDNSKEWGAFVEWEPIDGLKFRTNVDGPRWSRDLRTFYGAVRQPGLTPSFYANSRVEIDSTASFTVEWRRRQHFEIRGTINTRPEIRNVETLTPFGATDGTILATTVAETPRATLRFRFYR